MAKMIRECVTIEQDFDGIQLGKLQKQVTDLVDKYGSNATLTMQRYTDAWGDLAEVEFEVYFERPETEEERAKRLAKARKARETRAKNKILQQKKKEEKELAEYKRLKEKFETNE